MIFSIIADGDVSSFDEPLYRSSVQAMLAVQGLTPTSVKITVRSASVLVTAVITFTNAVDANAAIANILGTSRNRLSAFLGVRVERTVQVNLASDSGVVVSDGSSTAAQSTNNGDGDSDDTALMVGLVIPLVLMIAVAAVVIRKLMISAKARKAQSSVVVQAVNVHDVAAMSSTTATTSEGRV